MRLSLCRSVCRQCHLKCLVLSVLVSSCLAALAWCKLTLPDDDADSRDRHGGLINACDDSYVYIPVAFVLMMYVVYLVECWHCRLRAELDDRVDAGTVYELIRRLTDATPIVWWRAICYHYVRRTRQVTRYRNADAFSTQVYYERINSHAASSVYDFRSAGVRDISRRLVDLEKRPCTRVRFTKRFSFASVEAETDYERQRSAFFSAHECRDDYMETREGVDFDGTDQFKERVVVFADPSRVPWYLTRWAFWLASVVLLSWPLRLFVQYKIAYVHYYIHKVFGVADSQLDTSVADSGSDAALPSNTTLIPTYSEAMRMDHCGRTESADQTDASTAHVDIGTVSGAPSLVPLLQGVCRPANNRANPLSSSDTGTGRTIYGTVIYDRAGRAFFRSQQQRTPTGVATCTSTRGDEDDVTALSGPRSRRRDAAQKRKRRRSYYEAVSEPIGSQTSLAVTRADGRESRRTRAGTSSGAVVSGISTSMSTPDTFEKLQNAAAWLEQLRPVKSFTESEVTSAGDENVVVRVDAEHESSNTTLSSTQRDHVSVPGVTTATRADAAPTQSAYDVIGRRVVRCRQDWTDYTIDDDDDLPPSYEDALRMRIVPYDAVLLDDISSVSTTSTYLSSEPAGVTPRRWQAVIRRPYAFVNAPSLHVETSL